MTARPTPRFLREERGLTLVELLVAMPMLTVLLGGLVLALTTLDRWNAQTRERTAQQTAVRAAIDSFVSEVRAAYPVDPGDGLAQPIVTATASALTFYTPDRTPTSADGTSSFHLREVAYQFTPTQLRRQSVTSSNAYQVLTGTTTWSFPGGVFPSPTAWVTVLGPPDGAPVSGSFSYFDASGSELATPVTNVAAIASIRITISASSGGSQPSTTTFQDTATIRETQST
ncbi:MAG: hypothetical protein IRZ20_08020 [Thermoleophilia bacterium]|nr:hypothetical protein [Thermoleophilia bacterium]